MTALGYLECLNLPQFPRWCWLPHFDRTNNEEDVRRFSAVNSLQLMLMISAPNVWSIDIVFMFLMNAQLCCSIRVISPFIRPNSAEENLIDEADAFCILKFDWIPINDFHRYDLINGKFTEWPYWYTRNRSSTRIFWDIPPYFQILLGIPSIDENVPHIPSYCQHWQLSFNQVFSSILRIRSNIPKYEGISQNIFVLQRYWISP